MRVSNSGRFHTDALRGGGENFQMMRITGSKKKRDVSIDERVEMVRVWR